MNVWLVYAQVDGVVVSEDPTAEIEVTFQTIGRYVWTKS